MYDPGTEIKIIGRGVAQNQALARCIEERIKSTCYVLENIKDAVIGDRRGSSTLELTLFDCIGKGQKELFASLDLLLESEAPNRLFMLFNLQPDFGIEKEALEYGVNGFLYTHDDLETFIKAIETVLSLEVWISRQKISEFLHSKTSGMHNIPDLTGREVEILKILSRGYSNEMIAEELRISPHTVKTHLSNIYKKIHVHHRRHAVQWVKTHL